MKKVLVILLVLAVLAGAAVFLLLGSIGGIVKGVVESVGTKATKAPVTLENVDFSLTDGSGELTNLDIGNPEGFASERAMRLGTVRVQVDTSTISSDVVVVKEVVIDGPEIIYEVDLGKTNIGTIQENVEAFAKGLGAGGGDGGSGGGGGGGKETAPEDAGGGKKVIIENLYVRNGRIAVAATFLGGQDVGTPLPEIHLTDLGKSEGGASAGEVAAEVLDAILDGVLGAVTKLDLDGLAKQGGSLIEGAGDAIKGLFGGSDDEEEPKKKRRDK